MTYCGKVMVDYAEKMISKTNKTVVLDASFPAKKIYKAWI